MVTSRLGVALTLVVAAGIATDAFRQNPQPPQTLIELTVLADDGSPVTDLNASEVTLKVGGRPRDIKYFELVRTDSRTPTPGLLPAPFATNTRRLSAERDVLLIIDEESIAPARLARAQDAVTAFVGGLGAGDRLLLLSPRQGGPRIDLGDRNTDLRAALTRFSGATPRDAQYEGCRTVTALRALESFFSGYQGRSAPIVVFLSAGIAAPPKGGREVVQMGSSATCAVSLKHFRDASAPGRLLGKNIYVVYAPELTPEGTRSPAGSPGLETLAGTLEGQFLDAAVLRESFARVARETSSHYVVGFQPEAGERPGASQRVEIGVLRDRVRIRFKPEVVASAATAVEGARRVSPDELLRVATVHEALPLQAAAFPARNDDGKIRLVVVFEAAEPGVKLKTAAVGLYDSRGRLTRWTAEGDELNRVPAVAGIIVSAGRYRMRVAAVDTSGRTGTLDTDVVADLVDAPPLKLSGMLLGVSSPQTGFAPRLQFVGEPAAFGYLEIYGVPRGAKLSVMQELAASPDGPALASYPMTLTPGATGDSTIANAGFAIDNLPAGDAVMRARISLDGTLVATAMRTLRKPR